jgi:autotransporter adhesin
MNNSMGGVSQSLSYLSQDVAALRKDAFRGIAATAALTQVNVPQMPGEAVLDFGIAGYKGAGAIGINFGYKTKNNSNFSVGVGYAGSGSAVVRIGFGFRFKISAPDDQADKK